MQRNRYKPAGQRAIAHSSVVKVEINDYWMPLIVEHDIRFC